jgi:hypothetical protein
MTDENKLHHGDICKVNFDHKIYSLPVRGDLESSMILNLQHMKTGIVITTMIDKVRIRAITFFNRTDNYGDSFVVYRDYLTKIHINQPGETFCLSNGPYF